MGGAVLGGRDYVATKLEPVLRYGGPTLSAFNAWVLAKGLETLALRMQAAVGQRARRRALARTAAGRSAGPLSGPRESPAVRARAAAAESPAGRCCPSRSRPPTRPRRRERAWRVVDGCRLLSITANLGDVKTTITHPATTTHGRMRAEVRADAPASREGLLRVAVGLEAPEDICRDLAQGL